MALIIAALRSVPVIWLAAVLIAAHHPVSGLVLPDAWRSMPSLGVLEVTMLTLILFSNARQAAQAKEAMA